ncbi:MAG TPA: glycosyltransferase family 39 protein [Blastocatellia bacterium]|nr:glycosyltransferase family 39 protein [Blastocatellia bacterium]
MEPATAICFLITLIAGIVCYGLFINRGVGLPILGYDIAPAERVMQGEVPYRDFIYNYTPGVLWLNAALMRVFGTRLITINAGLFVFKLATLIALYQAARRLTTPRAALIPVALALSWVGYRVVLRPYPAQYSMLFVILGLIFLLNYDKTEKVRWLSLCGAAVGVVFLFKQNVGLLLIVLVTAGVFAREMLVRSDLPEWRDRAIVGLKRASFSLIGFVVIATALIVYLVREEALRAMLEHFLSLADEYGEKRAVMLPRVTLLFPVAIGSLVTVTCAVIALRKAPRLFELFVAFAIALGAIVLLIPGRGYAIKESATASISYLPPVLLMAVFARIGWTFNKARRSAQQRSLWWRRTAPALMVALFAFGAYSEVYPRADYAHLVRILPLTFLLLFLAAGETNHLLTAHFRDRLQSPRRAALMCVGAPLLLLFAVGIKDAWQPRVDSSLRFVEQTPLSLERARGIIVGRKQAGFIEHLAATIEANSSPDDCIFSFAPHGTAFYFLSARRNPTRLVWWRSAGIKSADRENLLEKIERGVPKLVLVAEGFHNDRVIAYLGARYNHIETVGNLKVYDRTH